VLIDESFSAIVRLYGPMLLLGLAAAALEAVRTRSRGWALVALGLTLSVAAALLQQAHVALHPVYFDHNAVYHVVQAAALVVLYLGFHEPRTDSAARAG
jgi:sugar phosphate permease